MLGGCRVERVEPTAEHLSVSASVCLTVCLYSVAEHCSAFLSSATFFPRPSKLENVEGRARLCP
eukprot:1911671-Rhodomonas_salina.1